MKLKRFLLAVCAAAVLLAAFPLFASAAPADTWDGTADTSWYTGGSSSYSLTTAEQLAGLASLVNAGNEFSSVTIALGANLALSSRSWTPIGDRSTDTSVFSGTFSGGGYSITGLSIAGSGSNQGLFGYVSTSGSIHDLSVHGSVSGGNYIGGIAGYCNGDISNCVFSGNVSGTNCVGAIAGFCAGDVSGCIASGGVSGRSYCGGISGHQYGGNISGSNSSCTITCTGNYAGGITGNAERCTVSGCANSGSVNGSGSSSGGIAGYGQSASIKNCTNSGAVSGAQYTGGIIGRSSSGSAINCVVTGTVSGLEDCGGIAGLLENGSVSNSVCHSGVSGTRSGGIAGRLSSGGRLRNCFSTGSVSGTGSGGVAGSASGGNVSGCYWRSGTASSAAGEGNVSGCSAFSAEEFYWPLDTQVQGCSDLLDALNADLGDGMNHWYASSSYPDFNEIYRLTVICTDREGNELQAQRQLFSSGEHYEITLPELEGMMTEEKILSGTMSAEDTVISVTYVGEKHKLTIEYYYEDGVRALDPYEQDTDTGSKYSIDSPAIEGYKPDQATVTGTMPAEDTVIRVVYKPAIFTGNDDTDTDSSLSGDEPQAPAADTDGSQPEKTDSGVRLNFFFWFLIAMILIGLILLVLLLCMLFNENGRVSRWVNSLLYPEFREKPAHRPDSR